MHSYRCGMATMPAISRTVTMTAVGPSIVEPWLTVGVGPAEAYWSGFLRVWTSRTTGSGSNCRCSLGPPHDERVRNVSPVTFTVAIVNRVSGRTTV